jgi:hypothetical protein
MSINPQTRNLANPVQSVAVSDFVGMKEVERP